MSKKSKKVTESSPAKPPSRGLSEITLELVKEVESLTTRFQTAKILAISVRDLRPETLKRQPELLVALQRMAKDILE